MTYVCLTILLLLSGCSKFGTAVSEITSAEYERGTAHVEATINDDGGCKYYIERGFCYSLFKEPSLTDVFSTTKIVDKDAPSDSLTFSADLPLPLADSAYYIRAFVKNSAGLSYSNQVRVSTKMQNNNE